jgi:Trk-type K+ transport system membrane component
MFLYFYFDWKICDALFNTKTKLQNVDYVLGNASICVYVKSVFVLYNVMGFMIIYAVYLLM